MSGINFSTAISSARHMKLWVCFLYFARVCATNPQRAEVYNVVGKYSSQMHAAVSLIRGAILPALQQVHIGPFSMKQKGGNILARESTLVPFSLTMVEAVRFGLTLPFPARVSKLDNVLSATVNAIAVAGVDIVSLRRSQRDVLRQASRMLSDLTTDLRSMVPEFGKPIAGHINFGLLEALVRAVDWGHKSLMPDVLLGFEPLGDVRSTGSLRPVEEPVPSPLSKEDNAKSFDDAVQHLTKKAKGADDAAKDDQWVVWEKTLAECDKEFCVGPLSRRGVHTLFSEAEFGPRCIPAFGIWQKGSLRRIDDACRSGHNILTRMRETIVCVSADLPGDIAIEFYKSLPKSCRLRIGTDDIASAYRVLQSASPQYNVAAVWQPKAADGSGGEVKYFALRGFNFGLKSAPVHLATLMRPMMEFCRKVGLVACDQFYDDVVVVDPEFGKSSAQLTIDYIFRLIGFPFAPRKHERMRGRNAFLGVVSDFTTAAAGYVLMRVKEKRRRKLIQELEGIRDSKKLSPGHAARIRGKLYFTTSSAFFGVGRPALQAFTARQYAKGANSALTDSLSNSVDFFIELLRKLPAHQVPLYESDERPLYVWSDAMWELADSVGGATVTAVDDETGELYYVADAAIAFTVFDPEDGTWHECHADVDRDVLRLMVQGKKSYIGQLEALAATAVLSSMPRKRLYGRRVLFWIDNLAAKYGLQKGYSKVDDSGRIINAFRALQSALHLRIHFEYVPSHQNLADLPSRGNFDEMFEVIYLATGVRMVSQGEGKNFFKYDFVLPSFESWKAPLVYLASKRERRSGSRGAKRRRA